MDDVALCLQDYLDVLFFGVLFRYLFQAVIRLLIDQLSQIEGLVKSFLLDVYFDPIPLLSDLQDNNIVDYSVLTVLVLLNRYQVLLNHIVELTCRSRLNWFLFYPLSLLPLFVLFLCFVSLMVGSLLPDSIRILRTRLSPTLICSLVPLNFT